MYRPWLASGTFADPKPTEPTGWTCWQEYDPESRIGIQHLCWKGPAMVVFKTG